MQVVVDSLLTNYKREGKGRTVVLLHGWGDAATGLSALAKDLAKKFDVIVPDLPGFGGSQAPKSAWGLDEYVRFTARFLEKIDAGKVYAFLGHSNGGAIAVRGLGSGKLEADKLVLIACAGIRGVYKGRVKALRYLAKAGKALAAPFPKPVKKKLRSAVYGAVGSDMLVAEHLQETFKKVVTDDVRDDAARLVQPTLLLYGEQDESTPLWYGETYHELIPTSTLQILPGAGHFVHLDRPQEVQHAIQEFLA